jgi:hypothetical protein
MNKINIDCVELQRKIRDKLVAESEMDLDKFFLLIQKKKNNSLVYKKLVERIDKEKQQKTA